MLKPVRITVTAAVPPLVGREAELGQMGAAVGDLAQGSGGVVLLEGEAGIGKTRLLDAAVEEARRHGLAVLRGAGHEFERGRPFGVLLDALGTESPAITAGPTEFQLSDAIVEHLQDSAVAQPLLLALDDLHWADPSTLRTIAALGRRLAGLPVLVLACFRPTPSAELDRLVDTLVSAGAKHLPVRALDDEAVAALAESLAGAPPGAQLRSELATAAGNPLFVVELVEALDDDGLIDVTGEQAEARPVTLPCSLRMTLLRRLRVLPAGTVELLKLCSVLGPAFSLRDLADLRGGSVVELLPDLDPAVRAQVLTESGEQLAFRHELIRAAVYDDLPVAVRTELHREVAAAMEASGAPPERMAQHVALGAGRDDPRAARWLRRTAQQLAPRSAAVAAELLERALLVAGEDDELADGLRADLVPLLAVIGRVEEAQALADRVLGRSHEPGVEARLRVGLAHVLARRGCWRDAREQAERAASLVPEPGRPLVGAVGAYIAFVMGDVARAGIQARAALDAAELNGNDVVVSTALMTLVGQADAHGDHALAIRLGRRAVAAAEDTDSMYAGFLFPELMLGLALVAADCLEEAEAVLRAGAERAEQAGSVSLLPYYHAAKAWLGFHAGAWDDALAEARTGLELGDEVGTRWVLPQAAVLARVLLSRGDLAGASSALDDVRSDLQDQPGALLADAVRWSQALTQAAAGADPAGTVAALRESWQARPEGRFAFGMGAAAVDVARAAAVCGDRRLADEVVAFLEDRAARSGVASARGAALRARGLVAGDAALLSAAVEEYRTSPRPVEAAWAAEDAAAALATTGRAADARPLFEQALGVYEEVGATRDVKRTRAAMRAAGIRTGARTARRRPAAGWDALTPAERGVADLVAQGLSNPQVAERLFVSRHTVESHLKHIYAKLGLSSRTELAAEHARHHPSSS